MSKAEQDVVDTRMHVRNPYRQRVSDFTLLAKEHAELEPFVRDNDGEASIDWTDPEAIRALTQALLKNDFDLRVQLPPNHLVPRVTNRLNYLLWLEDLLNGAPVDTRLPFRESLPALQGLEKRSTVRAFDLGTGASAIYALLGARMHGWHFVASELDAESVEAARENAQRNGLQALVDVRQAKQAQDRLCAVLDQEQDAGQWDFCMCNPPFFEDSAEKRALAFRVCEATEGELAAEGGEVAFVGGIVEDSFVLRERFRWYTSMVGRKKSLKPLIAKLKTHADELTCIVQSVFVQGKAHRWALAWSFTDVADAERMHVVYPEYKLLSKKRKRTQRDARQHDTQHDQKRARLHIPLPERFDVAHGDAHAVLAMLHDVMGQLHGCDAAMVFDNAGAGKELHVEHILHEDKWSVSGHVAVEGQSDGDALQLSFESAVTRSPSSRRLAIETVCTEPTREEWFLALCRVIRMVLLASVEMLSQAATVETTTNAP